MAPSERESRQVAIKGWNQAALETTAVVYGRGWVGTLTVLGLAMLGVRRLIWLGPFCAHTQSLADWFLSDSFGAEICDLPIALEFGTEIDWLCTSTKPTFFVICTDNPRQWAFAKQASEKLQARCLSVTGSCGGCLMYDSAPQLRDEVAGPILSLALAAMAVDSVREWAMNSSQPVLPKSGCLGWRIPETSHAEHIILIGAGGIGSWFLLALLAAARTKTFVTVVDDDSVSEHNRNRQLYTGRDSQRVSFKADALAAAMKKIFCGADLRPDIRRVNSDYLEELVRMRPEPSMLISAVDNAEARLVVQALGNKCRCPTTGAEYGMPVVQAGTDTWAADVFVQVPEGPTLDQQLFGELSAAAERERNRQRQGGCSIDPSYVVPSMMAGAMSAYAALRVLSGEEAVAPMRWRSGTKPIGLRGTCGELDLSTIARGSLAATC